MKKSDIFWQTYLNLESSLVDLGKYVLISDVSSSEGWRNQLDVFSPYIADLLVSCCVQIESISKELYFNLGGTKERGSVDLYFDEDCLKLVDITWNVSRKVVHVVSPIFYLTKEENKVLHPLKNSGKRKGIYWEKAYQAVKHDRYESMPKGNIRALIGAMSALYLLNIYYRNDSWLTNCGALSSFDWSMGSSVFSILPPSTDRLWYGNEPIISDSPFVASFTDEGYSRIKRIQDKEKEAIHDYLLNQPEMNDPEFLKWMQEVKSQNKDANVGVELAIYRINKNIPSTLSFEEKKNLLLKSQEWALQMTRDEKSYKADELNDDNIQSIIEDCGRFFGLIKMRSIQKFEWVPLVMDEKICKVYIPYK